MSKNIDIKFDPKKILAKLKTYQKPLAKHAIFIVIIVVLLSYSFVVFKISQLSSTEPSDEDTTTALAKSSVTRIDQSAITQIQNLENNNVNVKALFDQARNNPFSE